MAVIKQTLNVEAINAQLHGPNGGVARNLFRRGLRVQGRARRNAPANSGRLRASIEVANEPRVVFGISTFGIIIGTNVEYAAWVHNGTGVYGPNKSAVRPTHSTFLVFTGNRGRLIHVRQTIGQRPKPFLKDALIAARG